MSVVKLNLLKSKVEWMFHTLSTEKSLVQQRDELGEFRQINRMGQAVALLGMETQLWPPSPPVPGR